MKIERTLAVALLLALNRKIPRANNRVHDLNFSLHGLVGFDLHGKTAGIVGTGKIGCIAAKCAPARPSSHPHTSPSSRPPASVLVR